MDTRMSPKVYNVAAARKVKRTDRDGKAVSVIVRCDKRLLTAIELCLQLAIVFERDILGDCIRDTSRS